MNKNLKRTMAQRRLETRAAPIPVTDDKYTWQRRFTWLVQAQLADPLNDNPPSPQEAGEMAKEIIQREFKQTFPEAQLLSFME